MEKCPGATNVTHETYMKWCKKMVKYYEEQIPFDIRGLKRDTHRMESMISIYRVLCSSAYLGKDVLAGGVVTRDILKDTGWKMPGKATVLQLQEDNKKSNEIEKKCRAYVDWETIKKMTKYYDYTLPVEWRAYYCLYVPRTVFTQEEIFFIKNNPQWLLSLCDDPPMCQ